MTRSFRRFADSPGFYTSPEPSNDACIAASAVMRQCIPPDVFGPAVTVPDSPRAKRRTKRKPSAKQKKVQNAMGKRMKACGEKWSKKTDAAKAKAGGWKEFQARHCKK